MTLLIYFFVAVGALSYLEVLNFGEHTVSVTLFSLAVSLILILRADLKDMEKRVR